MCRWKTGTAQRQAERRTAHKYSNVTAREGLRQAVTDRRPAPATPSDLAAESSHRGGQGFKSPQLHAGQGPIPNTGAGLSRLCTATLAITGTSWPPREQNEMGRQQRRLCGNGHELETALRKMPICSHAVGHPVRESVGVASADSGLFIAPNRDEA